MLDASRRARAAAGRLADRLLQEQHRQQGRVLRRARELPDAAVDALRRHRAAPDAVLRQPPGRLRGRAGRHRPGRPRPRLPDQPARGLLRGRGRSRDHAQAADHQHPRRAARRPGEVPPAARDHRRREPRRGLDLPQGRHHRAGAVDDRGAVPHPGPHHRRARLGAPCGLARPDAEADHHHDRRAHPHRRTAAAGVPRPGPQVRRGPATAPTPTTRPSTSWPAGSRCSTASSATRCCAPPSSTGWPS